MFMYGYGPFFGPLWGILTAIFWVALIWFIFGAGRRRRRWHDEATPEEILAERFAKGEITEKEYKERLDVLKKNAH